MAYEQETTEENASGIEVFVMQQGDNLQSAYGALADYSEENEEHLIAKVCIEDSEGSGHTCNVQGAFEVLRSIDYLADSNELRDTLMVFFTAGFRAGMKNKVARRLNGLE